MSPVIEEHTEARLITEATDTFAVPVDLQYDAGSDPRTVHVAFPGGTDWAFGRDLLEGGMRSPARRGPIRIWPCGRAQLVVEKHSADGVEVVQFDNASIIRFLHRIHDESSPEAAQAVTARA
ncbi:SsgA family sporulation/cell division regulator [Streptomyces sp. NPDC056653]|uniref:SsgA family sporulation/cell division regulator n=1 Tax=Streptomyces sp. NPDC056653 TaxID=3345894 RepID=UPI00367DBFD4